jgi:hypothetical protein
MEDYPVALLEFEKRFAAEEACLMGDNEYSCHSVIL